MRVAKKLSAVLSSWQAFEIDPKVSLKPSIKRVGTFVKENPKSKEKTDTLIISPSAIEVNILLGMNMSIMLWIIFVDSTADALYRLITFTWFEKASVI